MCKQLKNNLKMSITIPKEKDGCHTCIRKWRQSKIYNQVFLYKQEKIRKGSKFKHFCNSYSFRFTKRGHIVLDTVYNLIYYLSWNFYFQCLEAEKQVYLNFIHSTYEKEMANLIDLAKSKIQGFTQRYYGKYCFKKKCIQNIVKSLIE